MSTKVAEFFAPEQAAEHLHISVPTLIALMKAGGYSYTSLKPGAKPWGRGRQLWGLTAPQLQAVMDGQARQMPATESSGADVAAGQGGGRAKKARMLPGHDGRSRLRRGGAE
jgi:hypothetical protein